MNEKVFRVLKKRIHSKSQERSGRPFFKTNTTCRALGTVYRRVGGWAQRAIPPFSPGIAEKTDIDNQFYSICPPTPEFFKLPTALDMS
jgi:hypothetical protein